MYAPPRCLTGADLPTLIAQLGGPAHTCRLLDVSERTLRRWVADGSCPLGYARLAWYASYGRDAADLDATNELRLQQARIDALQLAFDRRLPYDHVPRYLADACNESIFTVPTPAPRPDAPPWHPAHPRNRSRRTSDRESA
jgi:hypothetical protein